MRTIQTTGMVQKQILRLEKYFSETCLPKTKAIAFNSSELLLPLVREYPTSWAFVDKIVVLLAPGLRVEVEKYYALEGECMEVLYKRSQIEYLDELLARDLTGLVEKIGQQ